MTERHVPAGGADGYGEIMLFGVRVKVDPMRKSVSMNNLSQYHQPNKNEFKNNNDNKTSGDAAATGYASADDGVPRHSPAGRERKRGVPWTEEEHKLFLLGLQNVGKGDWRGISRKFVKTRTPTQVASHAQKYFLRKTNLNRRRRRSSLFDITTHSVTETPMEEEHDHHQNNLSPHTPNIPAAPHPVSVGPAVNPISGSSHQVNNSASMPSGSVSAPLLESPLPSTAVDITQTLTKDDPTLSLNLSLSFDHRNQLSPRQTVYQVARNLSNGDGMISVV